jgi:hypothetical protein
MTKETSGPVAANVAGEKIARRQITPKATGKIRFMIAATGVTARFKQGLGYMATFLNGPAALLASAKMPLSGALILGNWMKRCPINQEANGRVGVGILFRLKSSGAIDRPVWRRADSGKILISRPRRESTSRRNPEGLSSCHFNHTV